MSKRRTHSPEFKAMVAVKAISGRKAIREIATDRAIHPIQVSQWKRQLLDGARDLFTRGKKIADKNESQAKQAELFQKIGRLQMELEWLKKVSVALMPMNCASWLIMTTPSSVSAANVRCWVFRDRLSTTGRKPEACHSDQGCQFTLWRCDM